MHFILLLDPFTFKQGQEVALEQLHVLRLECLAVLYVQKRKMWCLTTLFGTTESSLQRVPKRNMPSFQQLP